MFSPVSHCLMSIISTVRERAQWILIKLLQEDIYAYLKNWSFWTVLLEKTLESPLDCKEIQPVHPKEISPGCSLEGLMLKLKLQYFGHFMRRVDSLEKTLMLGGIGGRRRRGQQRMKGWMASPTQWTWVWVHSGSWWWTGRPGVLRFMGSQRVGHDWVTELNWMICLTYTEMTDFLNR